jgi:O-succinylhomoserine sulfhydrylase
MKLGGNIIAFEVKGGLEKGRAFMDNIKLCSLSPNLGDTRTIIVHRHLASLQKKNDWK